MDITLSRIQFSFPVLITADNPFIILYTFSGLNKQKLDLHLHTLLCSFLKSAIDRSSFANLYLYCY